LECCALSKIKGFNFEFDFDISSNSFSSYSSMSSKSSLSSISSISDESSASSASSSPDPNDTFRPVIEVAISCGHLGEVWHSNLSWNQTISDNCPSANASWLGGPGWGRKRRWLAPTYTTNGNGIVSVNFNSPYRGTHGPGAANLNAIGVYAGIRRTSDGAFILKAYHEFPAQLWYNYYAGNLASVIADPLTDTWSVTALV
jgi:hypothetical protein